jgi:hypothetical protein
VCKDDNQRASDNEIVYRWTLNKYLGPTDGSEIGRYVFPLSDIGSGLTSGFILEI